METLVHPAESRESDDRTGLRILNPYVQSYEAAQAEVRCDDDAAPAHLFHSPHWLTEDVHGSHLVNFPFAFTVFMILTTGLTAVGLGITVTNAWLAGVGALASLVGCFLYGWSLHDE